MIGIIPINKPQGFTSHDVVGKMRRILGIRKIGHAGTLDPMATGVLILLVGKATRLSDILIGSDKRYRAVLRLGVATDTQDITGKVLTEKPVFANARQVKEILPRFTGEIRQTPPMYSALKVKGQALYKMARRGKEIERKQRSVHIHALELVQADPARHEYTLDVCCSKGTYIRTLCADIGDALGCGGTMASLKRMQACGFAIEDCITLDECEQLAQMGEIAQILVKPDACLTQYPALYLDERLAGLFQNGVMLGFSQVGLGPDDGDALYRVYTCGEDLLALGYADPESQTLKVYRSLY